MIGAAIEKIHPSRRGQVSGLWMSSMFIGQFINPPLFAVASANGAFLTLIVALSLVCGLIGLFLLANGHID